MLHCWMIEARQHKGVQHWKLGFEALCRADAHRCEKRICFNTWRITLVEGRFQLPRHNHVVSMGTPMGGATL